MDLAARLDSAGCAFRYLPDASGVQDERKDMRGLLADAELGGAGAVAVYSRQPKALALVGSFAEQRPQMAAALRALLALDLPPLILARLAEWPARVSANPEDRLPWFDLLHRYAYWRGVKKALADPGAWEQVAHGAVILMYHGFTRPGESRSRFCVSPRQFGAQMRWLKRRGYRVIDLPTYAADRRAGALSKGRTVMLTIDDGYAEVRPSISGMLAATGYGATVFLPTAFAGGENCWDPEGELHGRRVMAWPEALALEKAGISIGAHSRSHRSLPALSPEEARDEIEGARDDLLSRLGEPARRDGPTLAFSYPYGDHSPQIRELVRAAGFALACSADPGPNTPATDLYALRRVEVRGDDSLLGFAYAVWTGRELRSAGRRLSKGIARRIGRGTSR